MRRLQCLGIAALVAVTALSLGYSVGWDDDVPFLLSDPEAPWIMPPLRLDTGTRAVRAGQSTVAIFERRFELASAQRIRLLARSVRTLRVTIDDDTVLQSNEARLCFKRACRVEWPLEAGEHLVQVRVENPRGPPLLSLRLDGQDGSRPVSTLSGFRVRPRAGASPLAAVAASDVRPLPETVRIPSPIYQARAKALPISGFLLLGALTTIAWRRISDDRRERLARLGASKGAVLGVALLWLWIFATHMSSLPLESGFDAFGHVEYVRYVAERASLPAPTLGWSTYHPPAFYLLAAIPVRALGAAHDSGLERLAMRVVPFLFGFGNVLVVAALARRLFPARAGIAIASALFAGVLPLQISLAAYVSNESAHAFFASLAFYCATSAMKTGSRGWLRLTSMALGLALLSKFTGLLVTPVVCCFIAFERWQARQTSLLRSLRPAVAVAAGAAAIGGIFYLRNWLRYGDPVIWNLDLPGGESWWTHPGFHTARYFLPSGDALSSPYFSSFVSFWDGLYTTFWGDGLVAGFANWASRPQVWDWNWMSIGFLTAVPAAVITGIGLALLCRDAISGTDLSRRSALTMLIGFALALGISVIAAVLRYPFFGTARSSYALSAIAPLALAAGRGFSWASDTLKRIPGSRGANLRILAGAWVGLALGTVLATFANPGAMQLP